VRRHSFCPAPYFGCGSGAPQAEQNTPAPALLPHLLQNITTALWGAGRGAAFGADVSMAGMGVSTKGLFINASSRMDTSPGRLNISLAGFGFCTAPQCGQTLFPAVYQWQVSQNIGTSSFLNSNRQQNNLCFFTLRRMIFDAPQKQ